MATYDQKSKTLLLVNSAPWGNGTGELFLRSLAAQFHPKGLCRYSTVQQHAPRNHREWLGFASACSTIPLETFPLLSTIAGIRSRFTSMERLLRDISAFCQQEKPESIWAVLNSPIIFALAHKLATRLEVPLVCGIWDPPEYLFTNMRLDPYLRSVFQDDFASCLKASQRTAVASDEMATAYTQRFGTACTVIHSGIHPSLWVTEEVVKSNTGEIIIGFAGSMYAKDELRALIRSIESSNSLLRGKRIKIKFVGRWPRLGMPRTEIIERHVPVSQVEAIRLMSEADLCYLPYPFAKRYASAVQLSFPSKMSAYVAAGKPILYHGPANSSPVQFMNKYPVGVSCHSNDPHLLLEAIDRCISDKDRLRGYFFARSKALNEELGQDAMNRRFIEFLEPTCVPRMTGVLGAT